MFKRVLLLSGQNTHYVGMTNDFSSFKWSNSIIQRADDVLEFPVTKTQLSKLMNEGPADLLNSTEFSQPAIMVSSIVFNI